MGDVGDHVLALVEGLANIVAARSGSWVAQGRSTPFSTIARWQVSTHGGASAG
ncbi:hypothetical protein ACFQV2_15995 [Actinokineospora soli]|uniref:Uncharacterized protein n=1 Tax=Actinokineospora soli TaxID=1048753 RepID=A0ABW2TM18_9PSEU